MVAVHDQRVWMQLPITFQKSHPKQPVNHIAISNEPPMIFMQRYSWVNQGSIRFLSANRRRHFSFSATYIFKARWRAGVNILMFDFSGSELTSKMKRALSRMVTDVTILRNLGIDGFGVEDHQINAAISNSNNYPEAAYVVICDWSDVYEDAADALEELEKILKKIKKGAWLTKIKDAKE